MSQTIVTGNTYPIRHILKPMGFKWNPKFKSWDKPHVLSPDQLDQLSSYRGLDIKYYNEREGHFSDVVDTRTYKQINGRCEDAPCCGCCGPQFY